MYAIKRLTWTSGFIYNLIGFNYNHERTCGIPRLDQTHFNKLLVLKDIHYSSLNINGHRCYSNETCTLGCCLPQICAFIYNCYIIMWWWHNACIRYTEYTMRKLTLIIYNADVSHVWDTPHDTNVLSWLGDHQCKEEVLVKLKDIIICNGNAEVFIGGSGWEYDWIFSPNVVSFSL